MDEFIRVAEPLEGEAVYESRHEHAPFKGRMTAYVARAHDALADGRTERDDDGKVFELVERGLARFAVHA